MHFLDCFPDKNKNFYPTIVVLNSQKTSCITSRLNSTPEFRTRGTPQLFAHTMQSNFRPLAILSTSDSRKTQHSSDQFTKRTHQQSQQSCTEDKEHASDASGQVTTMHRCHQRDFPHAQIGSTLPLAPRPTRSCACCPPAAHDEGRRFCEHGARARGHTSEALWHNKA